MQAPSNGTGAEETADFKGVVGTRVIVEPEGPGDRFSTTVAGWEKGKFFLLNLPPTLGLRAVLGPDKSVIVRYLGPDGRICGFSTAIQGLINAPVRLIALDYPRRIISVNLRKADRMYTFLPATGALAGSRWPGYIVNLSVAGCRFVPTENHGLPTVYRDNMETQMDFILYDREEHALHSPGLVRRITHDNENIYFGIEFTSASKEFEDCVAGYVETLKKYIGDLFSIKELV